MRGKTILDSFLTECRSAMFVRPVRIHRKCHISMYFLRKAAASRFMPREKISCFLEKNTIIPDNIKVMYRRGLFGKTIFSESLKKISYFRVFFWERSSFIFRLRCKIIFSGKRNIIFPDNTRKINFFGKTIFSGRLEKENMVFPAVKKVYCMDTILTFLFCFYYYCFYFFLSLFRIYI